MSAITRDKIKVTSPWDIQTIEELSIKKSMNHHAQLRIRSIISESTAAKVGLQETMQDSIQIYTEDEGKKVWLFKGRLKDVNVNFKAGLYTLTAWFISETIILDREKKSRSFQDTSLTYSDIAAQIMEDYPDKSFELTVEPLAIDGPLIQYQETDWQFIKRLASYQEAVIVPDVTMDGQIFSYGYPSGYAKTLPDTNTYTCGKDIKAYYTDNVFNPDLNENEYTYFEVESYDEFIFGDKVTFRDIELYVGAIGIQLKNGLLVYTVKLVRQMVLRQNHIYNEKLQGISLQGTILALQNQEIKLHLDIDQDQDEAAAYWYPFAPPTTDILYLMPQIGTNASLYIPGEYEQKAIITGCVRTNGAECEQTSDPSTRYLATEYGQEMKLAPGGIYFTAGNEELIVTFDDAEGVTISSHKGMVIEAKEEVIFDSQTKIVIEAPRQIVMSTPMGGFSMENEMHFCAINTCIDCDDDTGVPLAEDQPATVKDNRPITDAEYAMLCNAVYHDENYINPEDYGFTLINKKKELDGFYGEAYERGDNIVVVFRGTDNDKNKEHDTQFFFKGILPPECKDGMVYYQQIKSDHPNSVISLTGHSLGGTIVQYVDAMLAKYKGYQEQGVAFAPAGIGGFFPGLEPGSIVVKNYIRECDIVPAGMNKQLGNQKNMLSPTVDNFSLTEPSSSGMREIVSDHENNFIKRQHSMFGYAVTVGEMPTRPKEGSLQARLLKGDTKFSNF